MYLLALNTFVCLREFMWYMYVSMITCRPMRVTKN